MARVQGGARQKVLEAAERIVSRVGGHGLTLDAVSEEAGISKGGLLYHFPSKDALLEGLLTACAEAHYASVREHRAARPSEPLIAAYLRASMGDAPRTDPLFAGIASALFQNPQLLSSWERAQRELFDELAAGSEHFALDAILAFAADGLWLAETYGMSPLTPAQRAQVVARMRSLARREAGPAAASTSRPARANPRPAKRAAVHARRSRGAR
jgi:AcrR family transcriptional regulator